MSKAVDSKAKEKFSQARDGKPHGCEVLRSKNRLEDAYKPPIILFKRLTIF